MNLKYRKTPKKHIKDKKSLNKNIPFVNTFNALFVVDYTDSLFDGKFSVFKVCKYVKGLKYCKLTVG